MKKKSRIKDQTGSITLFVLVSMIFFTMIVTALYVNTNYKVQAQERETKKIQQTYQKEDINEIYKEHKES